jgi:hypothetical protein
MVTLDSSNGTFDVVAEIGKGEYWVLDSDSSAIDSSNRIMYTYLQVNGSVVDNPCLLVGANIL